MGGQPDLCRTVSIRLPRQLSQPEIDAVVVYLRARVVGRRAVTPEECSYYYGEDADAFCDDPNADK